MHDSPAPVWAVVLAAGQSTRLARSGVAARKQFLEFEGSPLFWRSARTFARVARMRGLVFVFPPETLADCQQLVLDLNRRDDLGLPFRCVAGGERRQDSVANGLGALPPDCEFALVHDAARPFASANLSVRLIQALEQGARAVIPGVPVADTIKVVDQDQVAATPDRATLRAVQTPQAFALKTLNQAHAQARKLDLTVTDDAMLMEQMGVPVTVIPGEETNAKITTMNDLRLLQPAATALPCVGHGVDVHKYGPGRPMKLGGAPITNGPEVVAHSDGDVLLHALTDALLGLVAGGDIGQRFPDSDPRFDNMASGVFVAEVLQDVRQAGVTITHVDMTIIAQTPRIGPWRAQIRNSVAELLGLDADQVNCKATTEEGLGYTGEKKGIRAEVVVVGLKPGKPAP